MDNSNYFRDIFESIPDYGKIVLLKFFFQNDEALLRDVGFSGRDINRSNLDYKNNLIEQLRNT